MVEFRIYKKLALLTCLVLVASACGTSAQNDAIISTAVAQTVQAGESKPVIVSASTDTPVPVLDNPTLAPAITPTSGPTLVSAPSNPDCIHATLVSEYPPDGTVYKPETSFTKTWTIKNEGTCTWDSSYRLIFWSGDIMGAATYYDLPEIVPPGDDLTISILLQAPVAEGAYTGYWRFQTPWNEVFGLGQYSQAFYAQILVDKKPAQEYAITSLTYNIVREPATGCPIHVTYTVYATITTNGEYEIQYYWKQKDLNDSAVKTLIFDAAGTKTISRSWVIGRDDSPNDRWMRVIVEFPERIEFPKAIFPNECP
jgi:hypothetical protein